MSRGPSSAVCQVGFRDAAHFLREHASNLARGSLVTELHDPPPPGTPFSIELWLPNGQRLTVPAQVFMPAGALTVVLLTLDQAAKAALNAAVSACFDLPPEARDEPLPQPGQEPEAEAEAVTEIADAPEDAPEPEPAEIIQAQNIEPVVTIEDDVDDDVDPSLLDDDDVDPSLLEDGDIDDALLDHPELVEPETEEVALSLDSLPLGLDLSIPWDEEVSAGLVLRALEQAGQEKAGGHLKLVTDRWTADLYLDHGAILGLSEQPQVARHLIGELLVKMGKLRAADRDLALQLAAREQIPIGQALMRKGFCDGATLKLAMQRQLLARLTTMLQSPRGRLTFEPFGRPARRFPMPPLPVPAALFRTRVDRFMERTPDQAEAAEAEIFWHYLHPSPSAPQDMATAGLDREEQRYWGLVVTGANTLRETYAHSDLGKRRTHAVNMALLEAGLAHLSHAPHPRFQLEKLVTEMNAKAGRIGVANHFEILDLHWMSTGEEVIEARGRLHQRYHLERLGVPIPPEADKLRVVVLRGVDEATAAIAHTGARRAYRKTVIEATQIENTLEILRRQASLDLFRRFLRDAEYRYAHIVELDPSDAEARGHLIQVQNLRAQGITNDSEHHDEEALLAEIERENKGTHREARRGPGV